MRISDAPTPKKLCALVPLWPKKTCDPINDGSGKQKNEQKLSHSYIHVRNSPCFQVIPGNDETAFLFG